MEGDAEVQGVSSQMSRASVRLRTTLNHIAPSSSETSVAPQQDVDTSPCAANQPQAKRKYEHLLESSHSSHHQGREPLKWNGWGYDDTAFKMNAKGEVFLSGKRYPLSGVSFPKLRGWAEETLGLSFDKPVTPSNKDLPPLPNPIKHEAFLKAIGDNFFKLSFEDKDRLLHSHGHTCEDIFQLRYGKFDRYVDVVIWPGKHEHVEVIVQAAHQHNVVIIPFGGGTSVSEAIACPAQETRMVVSLDMHEMNRIKWIDYDSLMGCIEAGVVGKDLDAKLTKLGLMLGHEPDSSEFSTLGGWVATRASGMKKNAYGNIEDLLISVKIVTPIGTFEKNCQVPRISTGPDLHHVVLGSEGIFGVITEAVVKLRPMPESRKFGSIVFPDFESGVACLREIARQRCTPASLRLMDNMQFQLGQVLKPESNSPIADWIDAAKKWYVLNWKGFQVDRMTAATLIFEGNSAEVDLQEKRVYAIAAKFGGMPGGAENGERGYFLTWMIAYIRDFAFDYGLMAESFETSVPWADVLTLTEKVKARIQEAVKSHGIKQTPFVTARVTQSYDTGACIYFYFGFVWKTLPNPLETYLEIESMAREEILKHGGSLSHHHGVGKLRKRWMADTVSPTGIAILKGLKSTIDPKNIFAVGNLI